MCSGGLISGNTMLTAGHCIFANGAWAYDLKFHPGANGAKLPFGSVGYVWCVGLLVWEGGGMRTNWGCRCHLGAC